MDDVDVPLARDPPNESSHFAERPRVLTHVPPECAVCEVCGVTMDRDTVTLLEELAVPRRAPGTHDEHLCSRPREGSGLLPDTPIRRYRRVLDEDDDASGWRHARVQNRLGEQADARVAARVISSFYEGYAACPGNPGT